MVLLGTNLHQVGCAMRPGKSDGYGKEDIAVKRHPLTVIDHAGLSKRFGLPTEDRDWKTLFVREGEKPVVQEKEKNSETRFPFYGKRVSLVP
jgi:hypothetical protein